VIVAKAFSPAQAPSGSALIAALRNATPYAPIGPSGPESLNYSWMAQNSGPLKFPSRPDESSQPPSQPDESSQPPSQPLQPPSLSSRPSRESLVRGRIKPENFYNVDFASLQTQINDYLNSRGKPNLGQTQNINTSQADQLTDQSTIIPPVYLPNDYMSPVVANLPVDYMSPAVANLPNDYMSNMSPVVEAPVPTQMSQDVDLEMLLPYLDYLNDLRL